MLFDTSTLTLEAAATVVLAVGLASAYFFGSNLKSSPETKSREVTVDQKVATAGKKKKMGKTENKKANKSKEEPHVPGGNETFSTGIDIDEPDPEDPALIVASLEAAVAAQENRKPKKSKKKAKDTTLKQLVSPPAAKPVASKKPPATEPVSIQQQDDSEWQVVDRTKRKNTTAASQSSFTNASVTDPGSPKENVSPIRSSDDIKSAAISGLADSVPGIGVANPESLHKLAKVESPTQESEDETEDERIPNSLAASRDLGLSSDMGYEESAEDDGFIPVKSKGRKRTQRPASSQSVGGGSAIRASESLTKKQRQNKARRDAEKTAKAEGEQQRLTALSQHKKGLENARIDQMYKKGKQVSGGMSMSVGSSGKAEWD